MLQDKIMVNENAKKKKWGQYPAILDQTIQHEKSRNHWGSQKNIYSFKIFLPHWLAQIQWTIFYNQLASNKFERCLRYRVLMTSIAQARGCFSSAVLIMRIIRYGTVTFFFTDRKTGISANDGKWHAICVTWNNDDGTYQFFKDGAMEKQETDFKKGYTIKAGGSLVLGQDQDEVCGDFEEDQSFEGNLARVNVWSYVLQKDAIITFSESCSSNLGIRGDVYKWSDFIYGVKGCAAFEIPSSCVWACLIRIKESNRLFSVHYTSLWKQSSSILASVGKKFSRFQFALMVN